MIWNLAKNRAHLACLGFLPLRCCDVLQFAVVRPHQERVFGPLQAVPPRLQSLLDHQEFPVTDVVIPLDGAQLLGVEGTARSFGGVPVRWDSTAPTPTLEASTSTLKGSEGSDVPARKQW